MVTEAATTYYGGSQRTAAGNNNASTRGGGGYGAAQSMGNAAGTVGGGGGSAMEEDEEMNEKIRWFSDYLDQDFNKDRITRMLQNRECRCMVDLNHLREANRLFWQGVIKEPSEYIPALEKALHRQVARLNDIRFGDVRDKEFYIGLEGALPQAEVNPRTLVANFLGKVVVVEGIVTRCSLVRPKIRKSVHYGPEDKSFWMREYQDSTMLGTEVSSSNVYPTEDADGRIIKTEFGFCKYIDYQTISIQELPEKAPTGQLPRSVDVILNADLVDVAKPGDRLKLYGVYRSLGGVNAGGTNGVFRTVVLANNVVSLAKSVYQRPISDVDIDSIKKIAKRKNAVDLLAHSLAPSIHGNDLMKKAVLLLLLGGMEKNLSNGTHIRGDINMLMVGDPSTAKSQMLRFVLKMAPLAIATTGRGSSGVGLTAAVTSDKDTGERRLEAGAMVLADRGIVCIDEFDKMSDMDRVAIHEVMEQQTVTIAKAGIHTTLNARCSVIAAANPKYGQYDSRLSPADNTAMPDSLMSRFDLVFIVLDQINPTMDRTLAGHVLALHQYVPPGLEEGEPIDELMAAVQLDEERDATDAADDESPFEKYHPTTSRNTGRRAANTQILKVAFLKKYIHYAKSRIRPVLTEEASDVISEKYGWFREKAKTLAEDKDKRGKVFPVTPRTLEALIRLATAHAKARLSPRVEKKDAEAAADLMNFSVFREVVKPVAESATAAPPKPKKPRTKSSNEDSSDDDADNEDDDENNGAARTTTRTRSESGRATRSAMSELTSDALEPTSNMLPVPSSQTSNGALSNLLDTSSVADRDTMMTAAKQRAMANISPERMQQFRAHLDVLRNGAAESNALPLEQFRSAFADRVSADKGSSKWSEADVDAALQQMEDANQVMVADDMLFFM